MQRGKIYVKKYNASKAVIHIFRLTISTCSSIITGTFSRTIYKFLIYASFISPELKKMYTSDHHLKKDFCIRCSRPVTKLKRENPKCLKGFSLFSHVPLFMPIQSKLFGKFQSNSSLISLFRVGPGHCGK